MAKTAAERQREYREKRRFGRNNEHQLNAWISTESNLALERLAQHKGMTKRQIIERLLIDADTRAIAKLDDSKPEWSEYFKIAL